MLWTTPTLNGNAFAIRQNTIKTPFQIIEFRRLQHGHGECNFAQPSGEQKTGGVYRLVARLSLAEAHDFYIN